MNELPSDFFKINLPDFSNERNSAQIFSSLSLILNKIKVHALERVKENAPDITDDRGVRLKDSFNIDISIDTNGLHFGFSSTFDNVLAIHEAEYRLQPGDSYKSTPEGGVGSKFFTRVIDYWAKTWTDWLQQGIDEQIQKGNKNAIQEIKLDV